MPRFVKKDCAPDEVALEKTSASAIVHCLKIFCFPLAGADFSVGVA